MRGKPTFLDYGLDRLVDMMVHMLALDSAFMASSLLPFDTVLSIVILLLLLMEAALDLVGIVVLERTMLYRGSVVMMLFGQDFGVGNGLFCRVVMVLVHLAIYCGRLRFMFLASDGLLLHGRIRLLVNSRVMFAIIRPNQIRTGSFELTAVTIHT